MDAEKTSPETKNPSHASPVKSKQQPSASPEMDEWSRHRKLVKKGPLTDSPGKSEEVPTESLPRKMDERGRRREIEEKGILTASPEKSEGVPAESSSVGKDPTPASPGESDGVLPDASSPVNRVSSSAPSGKSAEIAAGSSPIKSEGRSAESSAEKIVRSVDKVKAVVVESNEVVESAQGMAGSDLPPLLPTVDTSFLDTDSQDSSPERRHRSTYEGKAVAIDSGEGIRPAARVGGNDLPRLLQNIATSLLDFDDEGDKENSSKAQWLVGDQEPLSALATEFETSSPLFQENIKVGGSVLPRLLQDIAPSLLDFDDEGDKEPLSALATEFETSSPLFQENIKVGGSVLPRLLQDIAPSLLDFDDEGDKASEENNSKAWLVGDQEPLSALAAEYEASSPLFQENIKLLIDQYAAFRRTLGDGNCFFRAFMFAYLENILESQDVTEVSRVKESINQCMITLRNLGFEWYIFDDIFDDFVEVLDSVIQGTDLSISAVDLLIKARTPLISDYAVLFLRFVTAAEIRKRVESFVPFLVDCDGDAEKFCDMFVLPMEKESGQIHITAVCSALGVPIRVIYLDRAPSIDGVANVLYHGFLPSPAAGSASTSEDTKPGDIQPLFTLLSRPGHYDILYTKK